jgi:hypothetical protein
LPNLDELEIVTDTLAELVTLFSVFPQFSGAND